MSIDFQRNDYSEALPVWDTIRNITDGANLKQYLRSLRDTGNHEDQLRQRDYEAHAVFYNVAGYTLQGMVGTAFRKDPVFAPPTALEHLLDNADGMGNGIMSLAKRVMRDNIRFGRVGLWVDFPESEGEISRADMASHFATINPIMPEQIINWATERKGAENRLKLIVFKFAEEVMDGFEVHDETMIRELSIEDGVYVTRKWRKLKIDGKLQWVVIDERFPTDGRGNQLTEIPFVFAGAENNDHVIDMPPMHDIVRVNIGHYRNSADYEDSVFYAGQSQPWMSGVGQEHVDLMRNNNVFIGSRTLMPVPSGESFGFATPEPNPSVRQAMMDKVELMIGLGARFIQPAGQAKTATQAASDRDAQESKLSSIAENTAAAMTKAVRHAAMFMDAEPVDFIMETDFSDIGADAQMVTAWVKSYLDGAVPESDYIGWMQRQGFFDGEKEIEEVSQELGTVAQVSDL